MTVVVGEVRIPQSLLDYISQGALGRVWRQMAAGDMQVLLMKT